MQLWLSKAGVPCFATRPPMNFQHRRRQTAIQELLGLAPCQRPRAVRRGLSRYEASRTVNRSDHRRHIGCITRPSPEVFKPAIIDGSAAILLSHNHPSGNPTPSREDIQVTDRLTEAGKLIGISFLDQIIHGNGTGEVRSIREC